MASALSGGRDTLIIAPLDPSGMGESPERLEPLDSLQLGDDGLPVVKGGPIFPAENAALTGLVESAFDESFEAAAVADPRRDPFPWGNQSVYADGDETEQTRIVPRREDAARFVLQFSTGESITSFGSGLLGRNPTPQPGEYFDQLVAIADPGKSVSKTHLEFGQDNGIFWVSDRFSGNGSIVREPEAKLRRCEPGKRYRVTRGSRVDIGEQFFIVS
jgi:hypothetical protein